MHRTRALFHSLLLLTSITSNSLLHAEDLQQGQLRIAAKCQNSSPCNVSGTLTVTADGHETKTVPISAGVAKITGKKKDVDIDLSAPGYWMPKQHLVISRDVALTIPVWRTTQLRGSFDVAPPAKEIPKQFAIRIETAPGLKGPAIAHGTTLECTTHEDHSWSCDVPAATVDVVIRAKGFTPQYAWNLNLQPGIARDLGRITLRQGASVVAWLDGRTAKSLEGTAKARLLRMAVADSPTLGDRLTQPVAEAEFNRRGFVQLSPVPAGLYSLEVSARGYAPTRVEEVTVYERSETSLRLPITLDRPLPIRFTFVPPADPEGTPWRVTVYKAQPFSSHEATAAEGVVAKDGTFELSGQGPGHYTVSVIDRRSNRYLNRIFDIHTLADAQQIIEVPVIRLHGKVTVGQRPITAELLFGGASGAEKIAAKADDAGAFAVTLPHVGKWLVDFTSENEGVRASTTTVIGEKEDEVNIDLPDTELRASVTGLDGQRVPGAVVSVFSVSGPVMQTTDAQGTVRFRGIATGPAKISASDPRSRLHSRYVDVLVSSDQHLPEIDLTLQSTRTFKGLITCQGQPVIAAQITGYALGIGMAHQQRAVSGLDGRFELDFPDTATEALLIGAAAGRTLEAYRMPIGDSTATLDIAAAGGSLRLRLSPGASHPVLSYNGIPMPMPDVLDWAAAQNPAAFTPGAADLEVANVAPGVYSFCFTRDSHQVCRNGTLAQGSTLDLAER
jgi:hypothetical protein